MSYAVNLICEMFEEFASLNKYTVLMNKLNRTLRSFEMLDLASLYRKTFKIVLKHHEDIYQDETCEIELDPVSIKYIDSKLNQLDLFNLERDIIGDAYEIFMGDAIKGQSGQFFTPQNAAEALVKMVAPSPKSHIIDPACGSGGFLVAALKYWSKQNNRTSLSKRASIPISAYSATIS